MQRRRWQWTLALVSLAAPTERADEALLPAVYREVGAALGASPTALGSLPLCRALVQAACYPLAMCAAARHDRARVVAAGTFLLAAATLLVGASGKFVQVTTHVPLVARPITLTSGAASEKLSILRWQWLCGQQPNSRSLCRWPSRGASTASG